MIEWTKDEVMARLRNAGFHVRVGNINAQTWKGAFTALSYITAHFRWKCVGKWPMTRELAQHQVAVALDNLCRQDRPELEDFTAWLGTDGVSDLDWTDGAWYMATCLIEALGGTEGQLAAWRDRDD